MFQKQIGYAISAAIIGFVLESIAGFITYNSYTNGQEATSPLWSHW